MSSNKRQKIFKKLQDPYQRIYSDNAGNYNVNLGRQQQYVPKQRRRVVTQYMQRTSISPSRFQSGHDLATTKMKENRNISVHNHSRQLQKITEEGSKVKKFQNSVKFNYASPKEMSNSSWDYKRHRYRNKMDFPKFDYNKTSVERKANRNFQMRTNQFIDGGQPSFIDSMARTMDSFNKNYQTYGGIAALMKEQNKRIDNLTQQKSSFLRVSNGYSSTKHKDIISEAYSRRERSQPGHKHQDLKYKQTSSFANTNGREQSSLNPTRHSRDILRSAEKRKECEGVKNSDTYIRFYSDEEGKHFDNLRMKSNISEQSIRSGKSVNSSASSQRWVPGSITRVTNKSTVSNNIDFGSGQKIHNQYMKNYRPTMAQTIGIYNQKISQTLGAQRSPRVYNNQSSAMQRSLSGSRGNSENGADSGRSNNKSRNHRFLSNTYSIQTPRTPINIQPQSVGHFKNSSTPSNRLKPYELWKQKCTIQRDSIQTTRVDKQMSLELNRPKIFS